MERRLLIAVALSILVIVTFQRFFAPPPSKTKLVQPSTQPISAPSAPAVQKVAEAAAPEARPTEEKETVLENGKYIITFSNIGGAIKDIKLKEYKDSNTGKPLGLATITNPKDYIGSISAPLLPYNLESAVYEVKKTDNQVVYIAKTKDVEVTKKYALVKDQYYLDLQTVIRNASDRQIDIGYQIIGASGLSESSAQDKRLVEVYANVDGKFVGFKHPKNERITHLGIIGWTLLKNKYFSVILKPLVQTKAQFYSATPGDSFVTGISIPESSLQPGAFIDHKFALYIGPSDISALKKTGLGLDETVNYGFFGFISKGLLMLMKFFNNIVHSWGISIVLLAIFLNVVLFPLTHKSIQSMQKMQALHPEMEKLKAQCKDNPQKLNKEMMELYKKYKINPLGGCLPMLLQMPIFIALYQALLKCVDLRGASFLWIKDLSMPDAVAIPFSLPLIGNHINILLFMMIIAMVFQQKQSTKSMGAAVTAEQKQQQRMMLFIMPLMFGFIFYSMPSGLVLYWFLNTALTVIEQHIIFKYT